MVLNLELVSHQEEQCKKTIKELESYIFLLIDNQLILLLITTTYSQAICTSQMDNDNHPSECNESEIQYVYLVKLSLIIKILIIKVLNYL